MLERDERRQHVQLVFQEALNASIRLGYVAREVRGQHREAPTAWDREQTGLILQRLTLAQHHLDEALSFLKPIR